MDLPAHGLSESDLADVYEAIAYNRLPLAGATTARWLVEAIRAALAGGLPLSLTTGNTLEHLAKTWMAAAEYLRSWIITSRAFARAPEFDYVGAKSQLERLNITVMNAEVDNRLVSFMNNFKADAKTLASVISQRQKFPEEKFANVKESFPVIIASIRQFGEYMPLRHVLPLDKVTPGEVDFTAGPGLATIALPIVLITFYLSLSGRIPAHRKLARITFPLWLYVSVTGVIVRLMLVAALR